jgi:two-component system chemotaxis response regulator CheY
MTLRPKGEEIGSCSSRAGPVLVVDDDEDILEAVSEALVQAGYSVLGASNGAQALEVLKTATPALILLDLYMPIMDGAEFRREQMRNPSCAAIPTVAISAVDDMDTRARDLGFDGALEKPVQLEVLLSLVARYCAPA